jgi:hypothetical protein
MYLVEVRFLIYENNCKIIYPKKDKFIFIMNLFINFFFKIFLSKKIKFKLKY